MDILNRQELRTSKIYKKSEKSDLKNIHIENSYKF